MALADIIKAILGSGPLPRAAGAAPYSYGDDRLTRWREALANLGYPYTLVPHARVEGTLEAELEVGAREGFSPVVIVPGLWNSQPVPPAKRARKALALITEHGAAFDAAFGRDFLAGELDTMWDDLEGDTGCPDPAVFDQLQPVKPGATEPGLSLLRWFNVEARATENVAEAAIMRVPTPHNHWIPVYLGWGGWNGVPSDLEIGAVAQHWHETYGARLVAVSSDQMEFAVTRKPADHAAAVALLKELYCFAPDTWEFNKGILEQVAADLRVAETWTFWWD